MTMAGERGERGLIARAWHALTAAHDPSETAERRPSAGDIAFAAAFFCASLLSSNLVRTAGVFEHPADGITTVLWALALSAPLPFRRIAPEIVVVIVAAAFMIGGIVLVPEIVFSNISLFLAMYSVGVWSTDRRRSIILRIVIIAAMFAWLIIAIFQQSTAQSEDLLPAGAMSPLLAILVIQLLTNLLYFGGSYLFGERGYHSRMERIALHERSLELNRDRELLAAQAVTLERLRIARELHDVVAHHVSLMGVQAAAARTVLPTNPEAAAQALTAVEDGARQAITEMRQLLGTLRDADGRETASAAGSTLGVAAIPELVGRTASAGLPVRLEFLGEPQPLGAAASVTAYRVVQEALTNVRKHGGPIATADVRLRYGTEVLEVEVSNTGRAPARHRRAGLGLLGMHERVLAAGGELEAQARSRGGFLVRARLPLLGQAALPAPAEPELPLTTEPVLP